MSTNSTCLFCKIISGEEKSDIVHENDSFLVIKNKFPNAPVHLLIIPKKHVSKVNLQKAEVTDCFYQTALNFTHKIAKTRGLNKKGYEISLNFSGYNHFDHEHIHLLSGHH